LLFIVLGFIDADDHDDVGKKRTVLFFYSKIIRHPIADDGSDF
jgi:hypothetical protein